ncbi:MAG: hypothetical protein V3S30_04410 [Thermoanaerobaculia bacterium]
MKTNKYDRWLVAALLLGVLLAWLPAGVGATEVFTREGFISSLAGGWTGENNMTPLGPMPFALLFEWEEDGTLHAHSALNRETYIDLRFAEDDNGNWMLREEAAMEGLGAQTYDLSPVAGPAGSYRWSYQEQPEFLVVDLSVEGDMMSMNVQLRGEDHASFSLERMPSEALPEMRRQLALQAQQSPAEGLSIGEVTGHAASTAPAASQVEPDPIADARSQVTADPASGVAHLALARVLGRAIQENTAVNGPRYSLEMLGALEKAIELEPELDEAYHWLVGYYMNAPAIVGGSIDKALDTARRLEAISPAGGRALLDEIEAGQAASE